MSTALFIIAFFAIAALIYGAFRRVGRPRTKDVNTRVKTSGGPIQAREAEVTQAAILPETPLPPSQVQIRPGDERPDEIDDAPEAATVGPTPAGPESPAQTEHDPGRAIQSEQSEDLAEPPPDSAVLGSAQTTPSGLAAVEAGQVPADLSNADHDSSTVLGSDTSDEQEHVKCRDISIVPPADPASLTEIAGVEQFAPQPHSEPEQETSKPSQGDNAHGQGTVVALERPAFQADVEVAETLPPGDVELSPTAIQGHEQLEESIAAEAGADGNSRAVNAGHPRPLGPPGQYRPAPRLPTTPRRTRRAETRTETSQVRSFGVDIRLILQAGGFCTVSVLPQRSADLPDEITVASFDGSSVDLSALQDEWYEDLMLPNLGASLRTGVSWEWQVPGGDSIRWSLGGREIYVLGRHEELSGFVGRTRLVLGEKQIVICASERRDDVLRAIEATGSPQPAILDENAGTPQGWIALTDVTPRSPVTPSASGDILDVLCPLPDVQIVFDGGIRIDRSAWLAGRPPAIRMVGDRNAATPLIDGRETEISSDGILKAPGWDQVGEHNVWCLSGQRSYEIREGIEEWEPWDAYAWSLGSDSSAEGARAGAICGALVRHSRVSSPTAKPSIVPGTNPILIGAIPGEIFYCRVVSDSLGKIAIGFPPFEPVWAVPGDSLHCDKEAHRILLVGPRRDAEPLVDIAELREGRANRERLKRIRAWCTCVLDANRKGLRLVPDGCDSVWRSYKEIANRIKRVRK